MMVKRVKDILSLKAFEPHPMDAQYSIKERLNGEQLVCINYGVLGWNIVHCTLSNGFEASTENSFFYRDYADADTSALEHLQSLGENSKIAISWGLRPSFSIGPMLPTQMLSLGAHCVSFNSVELSSYFQLNEYKTFEAKLISLGHSVLRTQLTTLNIISHILAINSGSKADAIYLVADQGFVSVFKLAQGVLTSVRSINASTNLNEIAKDLQKGAGKVVYYATPNSKLILDEVGEIEELKALEWECFESDYTQSNHLEYELITNE